MDFKTLLLNVGFLVSIAVLGAVLGKKIRIDDKSIASLLIYIISPLAIFSAIYSAPFESHYLGFTLFFYLLACLLATISYWLGKKIWKQGSTANLLGFSAGTGNTGYFGLSLAIALLNDQGVAIAVFSIFGFTLYEFTYGYYLVSRGHYSVQDSIKKLAKIPLVYAFIIAILFQYLNINLPIAIANGLTNFKATYSVLGMMLIGLSLVKLKHLNFDLKFFLSTLFCKFIIWPAVVLAVIFSGLLPESWMTPNAISAMLLLSIVPLAGNCVVVAIDLNVTPEKVATAVMGSTLLSVIIIPIFLALLF